jgi:hypothetical protein
MPSTSERGGNCSNSNPSSHPPSAPSATGTATRLLACTAILGRANSISLILVLTKVVHNSLKKKTTNKQTNKTHELHCKPPIDVHRNTFDNLITFQYMYKYFYK